MFIKRKFKIKLFLPARKHVKVDHFLVFIIIIIVIYLTERQLFRGKKHYFIYKCLKMKKKRKIRKKYKKKRDKNVLQTNNDAFYLINEVKSHQV